MDYSTYSYVTPAYVKAFMRQPSTYPEFASAAAQVITEYVRHFNPDKKIFIDHVHELAIRRLLHWEHQLQRRIPLDLREYWIRLNLGLIQRDEAYERDVLKLHDPVFH